MKLSPSVLPILLVAILAWASVPQTAEAGKEMFTAGAAGFGHRPDGLGGFIGLVGIPEPATLLVLTISGLLAAGTRVIRKHRLFER